MQTMPLRDLAHRALWFYIRNVPLSKGKERVLKALWRPLSFSNFEREADLRLLGVRVSCDISKYLQRRLYFFGGSEEETCRHWIKFAAGAKIVFDVGANVGLYSLLAAIKNPNAVIHAFEPTPEIADRFIKNIRLNNLENVRVNRMAIGSDSRTSYLHLCYGSDGCNEGMNYVDSQNMGCSDRPVEMTSLDEYCRNNGISRIDLLKLDIEGGEYSALLGARELLETGRIGIIVIELMEWAANRYGHSTIDIKKLLAQHGYTLYSVNRASLSPIPHLVPNIGINMIALLHPPGPRVQ